MTASTTRTATFLLRQPRQVQGFREPLDGELALIMVWIPPGRFWMGSPQSEPERQANEGPQHLVQLQAFFMGQTPITQAQWRAVMGNNPSRFSDQPDTDQRPVEQVSWDDAMEFCSRLSQLTGRTYTLPSEAQWEYACRAGSSTPFAFGESLSDALANYDALANGDASATNGPGPMGESRKHTTPVGSFPANAWGLKDMHGNVWEWCLDHWHDSYQGAPADGSAWLRQPSQGEQAITKAGEDSASDLGARLLRGGSWNGSPGLCRAAIRSHCLPNCGDDIVGFRVVCLPHGPSLTPSSP